MESLARGSSDHDVVGYHTISPFCGQCCTGSQVEGTQLWMENPSPTSRISLAKNWGARLVCILYCGKAKPNKYTATLFILLCCIVNFQPFLPSSPQIFFHFDMPQFFWTSLASPGCKKSFISSCHHRRKGGGWRSLAGSC